jgi:hypothetical protein
VISFVTTPDTITTVDTGTSIDLTINKWFAWFAWPTFARPSLTLPSFSMPDIARPNFNRPSIDMPTFTLPSIQRPTWDIWARRDKITGPHITIPTIDIDIPSIKTWDIIHKTDISWSYNTDAWVIASAKYISVGGEKITGSVLSGKLTTWDEVLGPIGKNFYASIKWIVLPWISPSKKVKVI